MPRASAGSVLRRGRRAIRVQHKDGVFTVTGDRRAARRLERLADGARVQPVARGVAKVEVAPAERDALMARVRTPQQGLVAHHAYSPVGAPETLYYVTDTLLVRFRRGTTARRAQAVLRRFRLRVVRRLQGQPDAFLVQVTRDSGANPLKIANDLAAAPEVRYAEPNLVNRFDPALIPGDDRFTEQWHLACSDGPELNSSAAIRAPEAWDLTTGRREVVVAILDDGFELEHPDLGGAGKIVHPVDLADDDGRPAPEGDDFHGTPCAGIAVAEITGRGCVGVAPGCALMPVRIPLDLTDDLMLRAFERAGAHADVICCSWGPPPVDAALNQAVADLLHQIAVHGRQGRGCVIVVAAGNYDVPVKAGPDPTGVDWIDSRGRPQVTFGPILNGLAAHPDVICVAASTSVNTHAAYSNWGAEIALCAPSSNRDPFDPQRHVPGLPGVVSIDNERSGRGLTSNSEFTDRFGGTSAAAPMVAGVAALMLSINPELRARDVREILQSTADKIEDPAEDRIRRTRHGGYDASGHSLWFGHGKVNAAAALAEALRRVSP
jgi:subtilisin family serine protease